MNNNLFMMSILKQKILKLPELQLINVGIIPLIQILLTQFQKKIDNNLQLTQQTIEKYEKQFQNFINKLVKTRTIDLLKDQNHRALIIAFIECEAIQHYKYSYFNRAKLSKKHIQKMKQVGPILFSQAVMIASKINLINKKNSRIFIQDNLYTQSESPIDMKIQQILKLCDQKKRNVNNNLKKLQLILEDHNYLEIIKQLGKMLRDSWKKDKSKIKIQDVVKTPFNNNSIANFVKQITSKHIDQESDNENCQSIKLYQPDSFQFTSSQNQMIRRQPEKFTNQDSSMPKFLEYDSSSFRVKSSFFNQYQNNYEFDFI